MGWHINEVENTVVVPQECKKRIFRLGEPEGFFWDEENVLDDEGHLMFDADCMEHMDYVWFPAILEVLLEAQVNGRIVFNSTEGDNAGEWWSYTFVDGVCEKRRGLIKDLISQELSRTSDA